MTTKQSRKYPRVYTDVGTHSLTKQSFKDECNINKIMAKFQKTGAITHYSNYAEEYGDSTPLELADAQQTLINAQTMFDDLPSKLRKKFNNKPQEFLEFVQNKENLSEMRELGLAITGETDQPRKQSESETEVTPPKSDA